MPPEIPIILSLFPGSTGCRHVQFLLKRRGLCPILCHSEFSVSCTVMCLHDCLSVGTPAAAVERGEQRPVTIYLAAMYFLWLVSFSHQTHTVSLFLTALGVSSWLPQKVSDCFGECPANHSGSTRYNIHTHPTKLKAVKVINTKWHWAGYTGGDLLVCLHLVLSGPFCASCFGAVPPNLDFPVRLWAKFQFQD